VVDDLQEQAVRVLAAVLGRSGAQDAAHTALEHARALAASTAGQNELRAEQAAAREAAAVHRERWQTRPLLPEHARVVQQLQQSQVEREQLRTDRETLYRALGQNRQELEALPRWARGRRRALTDTISRSGQELRRSEPTVATVDAEVDRLTRQAAQHTRERLTSELTGPHRSRPGRWDLSRASELARPWPAPAGDHDLTAIVLPGGREPYRGAERDLDGGLTR
jgi:hypothetical protein